MSEETPETARYVKRIREWTLSKQRSLLRPTPTPHQLSFQIHAAARSAFFDGKTKSIPYRKEQIAQLGYLIKDNEDRIHEALKLDLGRHPLESELYDFGPSFKDIRIAYDNVERWTAPQSAEFNMSYFSMGPKTKAEPKGTVLIVSAFNLPVFLTISPMASAIAAGCTFVLKPSEATPNMNKLWAELLPKYLDPNLYKIILGGPEQMKKVLELRWDHILYIGGERVGRIIAEAAAKHLTPTTLELGGKNPVVVDSKADLKLMAKRVLWGRFGNAGQVCTAPEYILATEDVHAQLVEALKETYASFYPDGADKSESIAKIVAKSHAERIKRLLDGTKGSVICGGTSNVEERFIAPTIVDNVSADDTLMSEEIFGPVLSVVPVKDVDAAIEFIRAREHPLCVYVFSSDKKFQERVFSNTKSGAAVANEVVISPAIPHLPVGGVGASGHGYYGSKGGFDSFTHQRVSFDNPWWSDTFVTGFRFPPYAMNFKRGISLMYPALPPRPKGGQHRWAFWLACCCAGLLGMGLMTIADFS
ncbi:aldehyde dehydrogenase [Epithele typhae]|uniref:aldehyde dehydrogenase n=1 Tax=Epithele typhae TaxID=378194 RepID=UPI002008C3B6|nr:aldehyde dehydrogenase [Epithele typhae]KAH9933652.1 aldehyde dehydrogenase [Epithele typhae]